MRFPKRFFFGLLGWALLLSACRQEPDLFELQPGTEFFPLEIGSERLYAVDSVVYNPTAPIPITYSSSLLREHLVDTFSDLSGVLWYRIDQYHRKDSSEAWAIQRVVAEAIHNNQALRHENDLLYIPLVFPVQPAKNWDGNVHFDPLTIVRVAGESVQMFKEWSYRIVSREPDPNYGERLVVSMADSENLLELRRATAHYAPDVGLIYRELRILDTQLIDSELPWEEKAQKGFIVIQQRIDL